MGRLNIWKASLVVCVILIFGFLSVNAEETLNTEEQEAEPEGENEGDETEITAKGILPTKLDSSRNVLNQKLDSFSPVHVYSKYSTVSVSPQSGSVDVDATDLVIKGKNGHDLAITRHYDTGTAISDYKEPASWCLGDIVYSIGVGWRLTLPYIKQPAKRKSWEEWEKETLIILPSGARYRLSEMKWLGTNNPRKYEYHDVDDFSLEYYSTGDRYLIIMRDGMYYELDGDGLVIAVHSRVDGMKSGAIEIVYKTEGSIKVIDYMKDTMNRRVYFAYGIRGSDDSKKPTIIGIEVRDATGRMGTDPYARNVTYTVGSDNRLLSRASFNGNEEVNYTWEYGYVNVQLNEYIGGETKSCAVRLLQLVTNPDGGKTKIHNGSVAYYVTHFYLGAADWMERALAAGVSTFTAEDKTLSSTDYLYTTSLYSATSETYISKTMEERIEDINHIRTRTEYSYITREKNDIDGDLHVHTLLSVSEIYDPSESCTDWLERQETYYHENSQRVKEEIRYRSANHYSILKYAYDRWGNRTWVKEECKAGKRESRSITWVQYVDEIYDPPGNCGFPGEADAPWIINPPTFGNLPPGSVGPKPHDLILKKVIANYYPAIENGVVSNLGSVTYLHTYFQYNPERQRTGHAEWDGDQWLYTFYAYHPDGRIAQETAPDGQRTTYHYNDTYTPGIYLQTIIEADVEDAAGNRTDIITRQGYDHMSGWEKWEKNARGYITEYEYDAIGRVLKITLADDDDEMDWLPDGYLQSFRNNNPKIVNVYNDTELWMETTDPLNRKTRHFYDNFGNVKKFIQYDFDGYEYVEKAVFEYEYDGWDQLIGVVEPINGEDGYRPVTIYTYDSLGNTTRILYPDGAEVFQHFDYDTNIFYVTNERGFKSEEEYDMDDRIIQFVECKGAEQRKTYYYYDALGNERIRIEPDDDDPSGRITISNYNELNQLERIEYPQVEYWENGITVKRKPYTRFEYNETGYVTKEILSAPDDVEHAISYDVDGLGQVTRISVPYTADGEEALAVTEIFYDGNGNKVKVIDANNTPLSPSEQKPLFYTYTAQDRVATVTDPEGNVTFFEYYVDGKLYREIDSRGTSGNYPEYRGDFVMVYYYDWLERLIRKEFPRAPEETEKPMESYTYYPNGNLKEMIAADGGSVSYTYTPRNFLETETISDGMKRYTVTRKYDERGNEVQVVDSRGYTTTKHYDAWDRLDYIIYPELNQESYEYDVNDNVTTRIDGNNNRTEYTYDKYNRLRTVKDAKGNITDYRYNRMGNLTRMEGAIGNVITYEYDELGRLVKEVRGLPIFNFPYSYRYDSMGNMIEAKDPNGTHGVYEYDKNNRLKKITLNNGIVSHEVFFLYDEAGYKKWVKDGGVETFFNYEGKEYIPDPYGRIRSETMIIDGKSFTTEYTYDVNGRVIGIYGPSRHWLDYEYNQIGQLIRMDGFMQDGSIIYDSGGYYVSTTAVNGVSVNWEYDGNGRLIGLDYRNGDTSVKDYTFVYDEADNIIRKNNNYYVYDEVNQLIYENRLDNLEMLQQNEIGYVKDDIFSLKPMEFIVPSTEIKLDYAASSIGVDLGVPLSVSRIELIPSVGNPVSRVYRNESTLIVYSSQDNAAGSYSKPLNWSINKKENGVLEIILTQSEPARYLKIHCSYDDRDEYLVPVNEAEFTNFAGDLIRVYAYVQCVGEGEYEYDGVGNRNSEYIYEGGSVQTYLNTMYTHTNRLKYNDRYAYIYDANGNLIQKGTNYTINGDQVTIHARGEWWEYEYDLLNRLVSVKKNGRFVAGYMYDGAGRRVKRAGAGNEITHFIYNQWGQLFYEERGKEYREHVYAFGKLFARVDGKVGDSNSRYTYFYHSDHMGSVEAITDMNAAVVWTCDYTAFGRVISERGSLDAVPMYTGKDYDDEGKLYYYNARWYDPDTGKFISEDPAQDGLNWYVYAGNNPLKYTDPTGLKRDRGDRGSRSSDRDSRRAERSERRSDRQNARAERKAQRSERREQRQEKRETRKEQREDKKAARRLEKEQKREAKKLVRDINKTLRSGEFGEGDADALTEQLSQLELLKQTNASLSMVLEKYGLNDLMGGQGCALRAYQAVAEIETGKALTYEQIALSVIELNNKGYLKGVNVTNAIEVINDAFSSLGSNKKVNMSRVFTTDLSKLGNPDYLIITGQNPKTRNIHYQLGDSKGNTIFDPGYQNPVSLTNKGYRGIYIK